MDFIVFAVILLLGEGIGTVFSKPSPFALAHGRDDHPLYGGCHNFTSSKTLLP